MIRDIILYLEILGVGGFALITYGIWVLIKIAHNKTKAKIKGEKILEVFKYRSIQSTRLFGGFLVLLIFLFIIKFVLPNFITSLQVFYIILYFLIFSAIQNFKNITIYQNGIYFNHDFIQWNDLRVVNISDEEISIKEDTKSSWRTLYIVTKYVDRSDEFIKIIKQCMIVDSCGY